MNKLYRYETTIHFEGEYVKYAGQVNATSLREAAHEACDRHCDFRDEGTYGPLNISETRDGNTFTFTDHEDSTHKVVVCVELIQPSA